MKNRMELEVFVIKITYHDQSATYVISLFFDILLVISTQFVFFSITLLYFKDLFLWFVHFCLAAKDQI
jgi:hypothetical protein